MFSIETKGNSRDSFSLLSCRPRRTVPGPLPGLLRAAVYLTPIPPYVPTRAYFSLNTLPRSRRGYNSLELQTAQLTSPRRPEYHSGAGGPRAPMRFS